MPSKPFPRDVVESLLVKSHRRCCICHDFCGNKMEIHHIDQEGGNTEDNGIPLCFNCHAEVGSYNPSHPKGRKFSQSELKKHRDQWFNQASLMMFPEDIPQSSEKYVDEYPPGAIFFNMTSKLIEKYSLWRYGDQKIPLIKEKIALGVLFLLSLLPLVYSFYFDTTLLQNYPIPLAFSILFAILLISVLFNIEKVRCEVCKDAGGLKIISSKLIDEKIRESEVKVDTDKTYDVGYKCKSCGVLMNKILRHKYSEEK